VWAAAPGWSPPAAGEPWPLIAIEEPCTIRQRALTGLAEHGIRAEVIGEAATLAGVVNAARAGLGLSLLALAGPPPDGLVEVPSPPPISLTARSRHGSDARAVRVTTQPLRGLLTR
jgi:DNA-binding transcriptional LysR family regulator